MQLEKLGVTKINNAKIINYDNKIISHITSYNQEVKANSLFVVHRGDNKNYTNFIQNAINQGATTLLLNKRYEIAQEILVNKNITIILVNNTYATFAQLASKFYVKQPQIITAVTGTNGKTSVSFITKSIWDLLGKNSASIGTLGFIYNQSYQNTSLTTPSSEKIHQYLHHATINNCSHVCLEASSHALDQHRIDQVKIKSAAITNISRDHLDYHISMKNYFAAKMRLFTDVLLEDGTAVINADISNYDQIKKIINKKIFTYGYKATDLKIINITPILHGQKVTIKHNNNNIKFTLPLIGIWQLFNTLASIGLILTSDHTIDIKDIIKVIVKLKPIPARLEMAGLKNNCPIYIDYGHTPDALKTVLTSIRQHYHDYTIYCIFGCGGDRDKGKRPEMGLIAKQLADHVIITDDNPRTEDPQLIRKQIINNFNDMIEIGNRKEAIQYGINQLQGNSVLLIAGKGHENYQIINQDKIPCMTDTEIVNHLINYDSKMDQ